MSLPHQLPEHSPSWPSTLFMRRAMAVVAVLVVVRYTFHAASALHEEGAYDFADHYLLFARYFASPGHSMPTAESISEFRTSSMSTVHPAGWPTYFPPFYVVLIPLTWMPYPWALAVWLFLNQAAWIAAMVLLIRALDPRWRKVWTIPVAIAFLFGPLVYDVETGQMNGLVLLGLTASWLLIERKRPTAAGACLAAAFMCKMQLAPMILVVLWQRRWRVLLGTAGTLAMLVALSLLRIDAAWYLDWAPRLIGGATGQVELSPGGQDPVNAIFPFGASGAGYLFRIFQPTCYTAPLWNHATALQVGSVAFLGVLGIAYVWSLTRPAPLRLQWALAIVVIELASPLTQPYHLEWLLFAMFVLADDFLRDEATNSEWTLLLLAYIGTCQSYLVPYLAVFQARPEATWFHLAPMPGFVGLCILASLILGRIRRHAGRRDNPEQGILGDPCRA